MVCDKSEVGLDACTTQNSRMSTSGNVVLKYQLTEMRLNDAVVTDTESDTPDSSMDPIIISETQPDSMMEPRDIHET